MRRFLAAHAVLAVLTWAAAASAAEPAKNATVLHLDQTAEESVTRDRIMVAMRAEALGNDPATVQADVNRRMTAALAEAKTVAAVEAASGDYRTYETSTTAANGKPGPPRWHAAQELFLVSRDFPTALALAGRLQDAGLAIGEMRFDVAPATLLAREQALTDAALHALTARAAAIAGALGLRVERIETLNVGNATQPGSGPRPFMMAARANSPAPAPPAVAAGSTSIAVTVSADIALAPRP